MTLRGTLLIPCPNSPPLRQISSRDLGAFGNRYIAFRLQSAQQARPDRG